MPRLPTVPPASLAYNDEHPGGPDTGEGRIISRLRRRSYERGVDATRASQLLDNIHRARVQRCGCTQTSGVREFFVGDINGSHDRPQPLPNLHGQVTQSTDAKNRQPLAWLDFGLSQGSIDGDSGTEKRRGFDAGESFRNLHGMTRRSFHEFCIAAIHGYASNLLFGAEILIAFPAEL